MFANVARAQPGQVSLLLMIFGAGATVGVFLGGRLADWSLKTTLTIAFLAQVATYAALALFVGNLTVMWGLVFALGAAAMLAVAPLRMIVLNGAAEAPGLASTMTSSAFNLGAALGAACGSVMLALGYGYAGLPLAGIAFTTLGLALLVLSSSKF
jgi:DHA1 family inner membrane transport protein